MSDTPLTPKEWVALHHIEYMLPDLERYLEVVVAFRTQALQQERDADRTIKEEYSKMLYPLVDERDALAQQLSAVQTELEALKCRWDW